jgi:uncharacterized protein YndB with AHSA1/START domain
MKSTILFALAAFLTTPPAAFAQEVTVSTLVAADGTRTLTHEVTIPARAEAVWAAISTAEGWKTWAAPVAWAPDADTIETSYLPSAQPGDATTIRQHIVMRIPGELLVFSTVKAPAGFPHFETYAKVLSYLRLERAGAATRVRLTQTGYPENEAGEQLLRFFETGNRETLELLHRRFAEGPIDWSKRVPAPKQ